MVQRAYHQVHVCSYKVNAMMMTEFFLQSYFLENYNWYDVRLLHFHMFK